MVSAVVGPLAFLVLSRPMSHEFEKRTTNLRHDIRPCGTFLHQLLIVQNEIRNLLSNKDLYIAEERKHVLFTSKSSEFRESVHFYIMKKKKNQRWSIT